MYRAYFGLSENPFGLTPDPRFLFQGERHREALAHLRYGILASGGFVQLTGEVGTGKTMLCRSLLAETHDRVDSALVLNPRQSDLELLASICDELAVVYPAGTHSPKVLVDALNRHLLAAHASGRKTLVIIDEAQWLSTEALEQVRLLTNLETETEKLLQIILVGQPELRTIMARPELRQLAQRVTARYHLAPLSPEETADYVRHRLSVAGCQREIFTSRALRRLHRHSGGVPRLINIVCDRALLGAYARLTDRVDAGLVRRAYREVIGQADSPRSRRTLGWVAAGLGVFLLTAAATALTGLRWKGMRLSTPGPPAAGEKVRSDPPPPETSPRPASLSEFLRQPGSQTGLEAALVALFGRWGLPYPGTRERPPETEAERAGLLWVRGTASWEGLRQLNRPAILQFVDIGGGPRNGVAVALGQDDATLDFGGHRARFPRSDVEHLWSGRYLALSRIPPVRSRLLQVGSTGRDVLWVRAQLDRLEGGADVGSDDTGGALFDAQLRQRVEKFQRARFIRADGAVGRETLAHLTALQIDPNAPVLVGELR